MRALDAAAFAEEHSSVSAAAAASSLTAAANRCAQGSGRHFRGRAREAEGRVGRYRVASRRSPRSAARPRQCCSLCNGRAAPPVLSVPAALRPSALPALIQPRSPTPPPAPVVGPRAGQRPEGGGAAGPGGAGAGARVFRVARPPLRPPAPRPPACRCQQGAMGATNPITPLSKAAFFFSFFFFPPRYFLHCSLIQFVFFLFVGFAFLQ